MLSGAAGRIVAVEQGDEADEARGWHPEPRRKVPPRAPRRLGTGAHRLAAYRQCSADTRGREQARELLGSTMSSAVETEVRAQEAQLVTAMLSRDLNRLSDLFDAEYVYTSGGGSTWGRARALQDFADPGLRLDELKVEVERVIPLQNGGVVTGRSRVSGQVAGRSVSGSYRFTRVWRLAEGKWKIVATHTSAAGPPS